MTIPRGGEYLNFGPFLGVSDFEQAIRSSEFDTAKHLNHARGWVSSSGAVDPNRAVLRYKNENGSK